MKYHFPEKSKRFRRIFISILLVLMGFILGLQLLSEQYGSEILDYFIKRIQQKTGGIYRISYDDVEMSLFSRNIRVEGLAVDFDEEAAARGTFYRGEFPLVRIEGVSILSYLLGRGYRIERFVVDSGWVTAHRFKSPKHSSSDKKAIKRSKSKPKKRSAAIHIKDFSLANLSFKLFKSDQQEPVVDFPRATMQINRLVAAPRKKNKKIRFEEGNLMVERPTIRFRRGGYALKAERMIYSKFPGTLTIRKLELQPLYSRNRFARKKGYRTSRIALTVNKAHFSQIATDRFLETGKLHIGRLNVEKAGLDIYRDKRVPKLKNPRKKKFPMRLLREMSFKMAVEDIHIDGGNILYEERVPGKRKTGKLFFTRLKARIRNLGNDPEHMKEKRSLRLESSAWLMGRSPLTLQIRILLKNNRNRFVFSGTLGKMDMKPLNRILEGAASLRVRRGVLQQMIFSGTGDRERITGEMKLLYNNLKISVLKKGEKRKRRKVVSFLANWILRSSNPKRGKPPRIGRIYLERKVTMPFFTYLWKSILSGIKSSVGLKRGKRK
jgi:hypothetical protein